MEDLKRRAQALQDEDEDTDVFFPRSEDFGRKWSIWIYILNIYIHIIHTLVPYLT